MPPAPEPWFRVPEGAQFWRPSGGRGWGAVAAAALVAAANFARLRREVDSIEAAFGLFLPEAVILLLAFFWLCLLTGETLPSLQGRLWFKPKRYGWGWSPATYEGWLLIIAFLAALFGATVALVRFRPERPAPAHVAEHLAVAFLGVAILFGICWKTGEKPRWRWGGD